MARSALVVLVPEAEPLVAELRLVHDRMAARGVPAHVTVLHPFKPVVDDATAGLVAAIAAATDNVGRFFGEDVFIALGAVLLIQGFYAQHGIELTPLSIALWALPTAIAAFAIQSVRIWLYQRRLLKRARDARGG